MEFSSENAVASIKVNYNAATEFLKTWAGQNVNNPIQDQSLGTLMITVLNRLQANNNVVATDIEVLVFVRLTNIRVVEAAFWPRTNFVSSDIYRAQVSSTTALEAQGPDDPPAIQPVGEAKIDETAVTTTEFTHAESDLVNEVPCKLDIGRKFEYVISDVNDLMRRYRLKDRKQCTVYQSNTIQNRTIITWYVTPRNDFNGIFAAWSGHMKYRIYVKTRNPVVAYVTANVRGNNSTTQASVSFPDEDYIMGNSSFQCKTVGASHAPREVFFPVGDYCFIDLSIPFFCNENLILTLTNGFTAPGPTSAGRIFLHCEDKLTIDDITFFESFGDDCRYGIPRFIGSQYQVATVPAAYPSVGDLPGFFGIIR
jgi:hypothetical protein